MDKVNATFLGKKGVIAFSRYNFASITDKFMIQSVKFQKNYGKGKKKMYTNYRCQFSN